MKNDEYIKKICPRFDFTSKRGILLYFIFIKNTDNIEQVSIEKMYKMTMLHEFSSLCHFRH